jgi:phospholipid N-methyltransferase
LPVPSFPKDLQRDFFRVVHEILAPAGGYSQITELALVYKGLYKRYFEQVKFVFEPRNFPPAGAYHCKGCKAPA